MICLIKLWHITNPTEPAPLLLQACTACAENPFAHPSQHPIPSQLSTNTTTASCEHPVWRRSVDVGEEALHACLVVGIHLAVAIHQRLLLQLDLSTAATAATEHCQHMACCSTRPGCARRPCTRLQSSVTPSGAAQTTAPQPAPAVFRCG